MIYLENPKRKVPKGYRTWREYMRWVSSHKRGRRQNEPNPKKRPRSKRRNPWYGDLAGHSRASKKGWRTRRRYSRNPAGIVDQVISGGIGAVEVLAGKGIARSVPQLFGIDRETTTGLIVQALSAIGAGIGSHYVLSSDAAHIVLAGGLAAPLETLIKRSGIPVVSAAFGETEQEAGMIAAYPELMGTYPRALSPAEAPLPAAMGEDDESIMYVQ